MHRLQPGNIYCGVVTNPAREHLAPNGAPWWESAENIPPVPPNVTNDGTKTEKIISLVDSADPVEEVSTDDNQDPPASTPEATRLAKPIQANATGLTLRGAFLLILLSTSVACVIGFFISGTTSIPSQAGWGLVAGTIAAALLVPERLSLTIVWLPPLVAVATVGILGQITLLGSTFTLTRELAMVAAGLTALAPAQVLSVGGAALILFLRRLRVR